jgi:hypothetical protein
VFSCSPDSQGIPKGGEWLMTSVSCPCLTV